MLSIQSNGEIVVMIMFYDYYLVCKRHFYCQMKNSERRLEEAARRRKASDVTSFAHTKLPQTLLCVVREKVQEELVAG